MNKRMLILSLAVCLAGAILFVITSQEETAPAATASAPEIGEEVTGAHAAPKTVASAPEKQTVAEHVQERRRVENAAARERLIAAIRTARQLRERRLRESGGDGTDGGGAQGSLGKETIRDAVAAVIEDVKACYDDQLKRTPELGGKLVIDFVIEAEEDVGGVVTDVKLGEATDGAMRESDTLAACIVDTIYTLELPAPEGGGRVEVSYPFLMSPRSAPP